MRSYQCRRKMDISRDYGEFQEYKYKIYSQGLVDDGELITEAAEREVREETGLDV